MNMLHYRTLRRPVSAETFPHLASRLENLARSGRAMTVIRQYRPSLAQNGKVAIPKQNIYRDMELDKDAYGGDGQGVRYTDSPLWKSVFVTCEGAFSSGFGFGYDPARHATNQDVQDQWERRRPATRVSITGGLSPDRDDRDATIQIENQNEDGVIEDVTVLFHNPSWERRINQDATLLEAFAAVPAPIGNVWTPDMVKAVAAILRDGGQTFTEWAADHGEGTWNHTRLQTMLANMNTDVNRANTTRKT